MHSILDASAEAIAIILSWGKLGRSNFSELVEIVKKAEVNSTPMNRILTLEEKYIKDIEDIIKKEILESENLEWYKLFKLYRNKLAHFRHYSGFMLPDKEGNYYHFLPKKWPYYFHQDIDFGSGKNTDIDITKSFHELLIEQDIFEYCDGLHCKLFDMTNKIFKVLFEAFKIKKESGCDINNDIVKKVNSLIKIYNFKHF